MNIPNVLGDGPLAGPQMASQGAQPSRYATRHSMNGPEQSYGTRNTTPSSESFYERRLPGLSNLDIPPLSPNRVNGAIGTQGSPIAPQAPKSLRFVHLLEQGERSRLTLATKVNAHDSTQSIIDAVRNFFGLFTGRLGFEDEAGCHIIPSYDNFAHDSIVYLRGEPDAAGNTTHFPAEAANLSPTKTFPMLPPASNQPLSRPSSHLPNPVQLAPGFEYMPQLSPTKNADFDSNPQDYADHRGTDEWVMRLHGGSTEEDVASNGSKIASAEISEANIVDGGRRKRAKFDTQDLPLFQPLQVPSNLSVSSASPIRRPYPQSASTHHDGYALSHTDTTPLKGTSHRGSLQYNGPTRRRGVLPTPDHTTASAMSDEDVAWQLVSLSDYGRVSTHGRTSTSTVDDAHSGKANASDAEDGYSEEESDMPMTRPSFNIYQDNQLRDHGKSQSQSKRDVEGETSGEDYEDGDDRSFKGASSEISTSDQRKGSKASSKTVSNRSHKGSKSLQGSKSSKKEYGSNKAPPSPRSLSASSRKPSNASLGFTAPLIPLAPDETDLSSKPRCQRCRKSKKGCDRERPCGRCKDAGLGFDDCVSEEETNNKKGRYGRHMGVAIKKENEEAQTPILPPNPYVSKSSDEMIMMHHQQHQVPEGYKSGGAEKNKKRKR